MSPLTARLLGIAATLCGAALLVAGAARAPAAAPGIRVLVFSKTAGYRHASIGPTVRATARALPVGRWQLSVVLEDRSTGSAATARRFVRIR